VGWTTSLTASLNARRFPGAAHVMGEAASRMMGPDGLEARSNPPVVDEDFVVKPMVTRGSSNLRNHIYDNIYSVYMCVHTAFMIRLIRSWSIYKICLNIHYNYTYLINMYRGLLLDNSAIKKDFSRKPCSFTRWQVYWLIVGGWN